MVRLSSVCRRQTAQRLGQEQRPRDKRNLYLAAVEGAAVEPAGAGAGAGVIDSDRRKAARDSKDTRDRDKRLKAQVSVHLLLSPHLPSPSLPCLSLPCLPSTARTGGEAEEAAEPAVLCLRPAPVCAQPRPRCQRPAAPDRGPARSQGLFAWVSFTCSLTLTARSAGCSGREQGLAAGPGGLRGGAGQRARPGCERRFDRPTTAAVRCDAM